MPVLYIVLALAVVALLVLLGIWLFLKKKSAKAAPGEAAGPAGPGGDEIDLLIREAESRLAAGKLQAGARVAGLPVIVLMGDAGTTKTSVMLHSGMEAELLAGQVYQDNNVIPTRAANLWFARGTVFVEAGGRLVAEPGKWQRLVRRLQPRGSVVASAAQAPRAVVVFFDCETFTKPGAQELGVTAARNLRARLGEISQAMGINLPVYVLFTKLDRLPFFTEYVRNLSTEEATQVLGVTLPILGKRSEGVFAEQETARLAGHFEWLFRSLADARPEFLARESDAAKLPGAYEFPREFRKIRSAAVQFLVDLCRPSQLSVGPFLRGFYFTGVRPVIINEAAPARQSAPPQQAGLGAASGATGIFSGGARMAPQPAAPAPVAASRKVPQWMFLSHFFNDLLLADRAAMGASGSSTKTSFARRVLLLAAAALSLILAIGFSVSFLQNRALESQAREAAQATSPAASNGLDLASVESLRQLDTLRQSLVRLVTYRRNGRPWSYRWGLYTGDDLYPHLRRIYFDRFRNLLFTQTQSGLLAYLQGLPATPGPEYGPTYDALKAYLITTSNHDKSTRLFLSPALMKWWSGNRTVDPPRLQLASRQFDFYADELQEENPFSKDNDAAAIQRARQYLAQFAGAERVYAFMLAEAGKNNPAINFNRQVPGSAAVVVETHEVPGAFSRRGWDFMKDAIRHADRYFSGEQWVLGDQTSGNIDRAKLEQDLRGRYYADFVKEWRAYIKSASVVPYANLKDAADKLMLISGNQSPLLALFSVASRNTAVDEPAVAAVSQPVQTVTPPQNTDRYIAPPNQNYMNALVTLQTSLEAIAGQTGSPSDTAAAQTLANATQAKVITRQMAQGFRLDPDGHVEASVQKLLEDPIVNAEKLLRNLGPDELNGKGRAFCAQINPILSKFPFNSKAAALATVPDLNALFKPKDGAFSQFIDANLQKVVSRQGSQFVPNPAGGIQLNPPFLDFLNRAAAFTDAAYAGGTADPQIKYTVKPVMSPEIQDLKLTIDGQSADFTATSTAPKQLVWPGPARGLQLNVTFKGGPPFTYPNYDGLWALFQFVGDADKHDGSVVEVTLRSGKAGRPVLNNVGQPVTVRLDLSANPPVFDRAYFSSFACVPQVAKP